VRTFPIRSDAFVEALGAAYRLGTMPGRLLAIAFAISTTELAALIRRHGWTARAEGLWAPGTTPAERAAQIRSADAARQVALYGSATGVADVKTLRSRGWTVTRERRGVRVGNKLCSFVEMRAMADRERRLIEAGRPSEIDAIRRAMEPLEKAAAKERQGARNDLNGTSAKVSQKSPARSADKLAFAGVSTSAPV